MPNRIEQLETAIAAHAEAMHDPVFFRQDAAAIARANAELARLQTELDGAYARWSALDG